MCFFNATATFFFFNDTATTEIYTLSLHDALPICGLSAACFRRIEKAEAQRRRGNRPCRTPGHDDAGGEDRRRSARGAGRRKSLRYTHDRPFLQSIASARPLAKPSHFPPTATRAES